MKNSLRWTLSTLHSFNDISSKLCFSIIISLCNSKEEIKKKTHAILCWGVHHVLYRRTSEQQWNVNMSLIVSNIIIPYTGSMCYLCLFRTLTVYFKTKKEASEPIKLNWKCFIGGIPDTDLRSLMC